ncbi:pyrroloquinoline quinone biosynthesis protein PqqB [Piscinibacter sp. XHJ-5]|uniref:pyrroloquinoline quinone biosynthesis protein PqqB n=1 Tax=Piscinibacter sp. XHJ-5 TaxID=3037797 RepID=UPI002452F788|nr:pyrroloquinoline quinone biosynthesis protein PqqB [Piscinibacter sp. XHJ-5]
MHALVLGSAAGGGFPQWNCNCTLCARARRGDESLSTRTQSSVAVSDDGLSWILLNASPDIAQQVHDNPQLHPRGGGRDTPIRAVILLDAHLDHVAGLLSLREGPPLHLYCTPAVMDDLTHVLRIVPVLRSYCDVQWHPIPVGDGQTDATFAVAGCVDLCFHAIALEGKAPPYSPRRAARGTGDTIALDVVDRRSGRRLFYAPGLARVGPRELGWMRAADCVLADGTFWCEEEMPEAGLSRKTARDMGHLPQRDRLIDGALQRGMMTVLAGLPARHKLLVHINNTNPILDPDSPERRELERHGIEVAHDGMEIVL